MSDIPDLRRQIQIEGSQFRAAVSEALIQGIGGAINFVNNRQFSTIELRLNGRYSLATILPQLGPEGLFVIPSGINIEIFDVVMYNEIAGSSGTTELDLKVATAPGGSFVSIFTTLPSIDAAAGDDIWVGTGDSIANTVAPVLVTTPFVVESRWALRLDLIQTQTGATPPENTGLLVHYRPTN